MNKIIIALLLILPLQLFAQTVVTGAVFDYQKKTNTLPGVIVKNLKLNKTSITNSKGKFVIAANVGDILEFSLVGYHADTLYLTNLLTKIIYLPVKSTSLNDVNIQGVRINTEIINAKDTLAEKYTLLSTGGNLARKRMNDKVGGLSLNLGHGKYVREQRKIADFEEREAYNDEINDNFNERTIASLTKLTEKEIKNFMVIYRPSVEKIKSERPFRYSYYIAQCYSAWLKLSPQHRKLQDLPKLK